MENVIKAPMVVKTTRKGSPLNKVEDNFDDVAVLFLKNKITYALKF